MDFCTEKILILRLICDAAIIPGYTAEFISTHDRQIFRLNPAFRQAMIMDGQDAAAE